MKSAKRLRMATLEPASAEHDWMNPGAVVHGRFRDLLAEALRVKFEMVFPLERKYGNLEGDGNWTGVLGMLQRGEADMAIGITRNYLRNGHFNFSYPYEGMEMTFATQLPSHEHNWAALTQPFDAWTWISVMALLVIVPVLMRIFLQTRSSLLSLVQKTTSTLLRQPLLLHLNRQRDRLLCGHWLVWSQVLSFGYMAMVLSRMTMPIRDPGIRSTEELSRAVCEGRYSSFAIDGTAFRQYLKETPIPHLKMLGEIMERNGWFVPVRRFAVDDLRPIDFVRRERTAFFECRFFFETAADPLRVHVSDASVYTSLLAVLLKADFCCRERLDNAIMRINAAGLYMKFKDDAKMMARIKAISLMTPDEPMQPLSMNDLWLAFVILSGGHALATLVLLGEMVKGWRLTTAVNITVADAVTA